MSKRTRRKDLQKLLRRMINDGAVINANKYKQERLILDGEPVPTYGDILEAKRVLREVLESAIKTGVSDKGMLFDRKLAQELKDLLDINEGK